MQGLSKTSKVTVKILLQNAGFVGRSLTAARAQALTPRTAKHFRAGLAPFCNNIPQCPAVSLLALTAPLGSASQLKEGASMLMLASQPQHRAPRVAPKFCCECPPPVSLKAFVLFTQTRRRPWTTTAESFTAREKPRSSANQVRKLCWYEARTLSRTTRWWFVIVLLRTHERFARPCFQPDMFVLKPARTNTS